MAHSSIITKTFHRLNRSFEEGDLITGEIQIDSKECIKHAGIFIALEGYATVFPERKNESDSLGKMLLDVIGEQQAFQTVPLVCKEHQLAPLGKLFPQESPLVLPFQIRLQSLEAEDGASDALPLPEVIFTWPQLKGSKEAFDTLGTNYGTYHGVRVTVQYYILCHIRCSGMAAFFDPDLAEGITKSTEIYIQYTKRLSTCPGIRPYSFMLTADHARRVQKEVPQFMVSGQLKSTEVSLHLGGSLEGEATIHESILDIKRMDLQLLRIEGRRDQKEASEVQSLEIASGNVQRGIPIPFYCHLPRLFCCARKRTKDPRVPVRFAVSLVVVFADHSYASEMVPIRIYRY